MTRTLDDADPDLRARLQALGAREWDRWAGVVVAASARWRWHIDVDGVLVAAPLTHAALVSIARAARVTSEDDVEPFLALYEHATEARVTRTAQHLEYLREDQPGPEIIGSGQIGAVGLERWRAPRLADGVLVFYANQPSARGADFVCVRYEVASGALSVEVVDEGWFEVAAQLG